MTGDNPTAERADLETEILSYLVKHPDAQDTVDGIVEWWFLEAGIRHAEQSVRQALQLLVGKGLVLENQGGSQTRYRLNRARLPEIRAQL